MDSISSDNAVDDLINRLARFAYDRACNRVAVLAQNKDFRAARGPASARSARAGIPARSNSAQIRRII